MVAGTFFANPFLQMALMAGLLAALASGVVGSFVVVKRIVFISGALAHACLGGIGLVLYLNMFAIFPPVNPIYGALSIATLSAYLISYMRIAQRQREDTVIGAIWAFGMSIGVVSISLIPGHNVELTHYLFGNILWSSTRDLYVLIGLDLFLCVIVVCFYRQFLAICFDNRQAQLQGLPTRWLNFLLLFLVAITVVLLIQVVGAILLVAILSLPAAIANLYTYRLSKVILLAIGIALAITCTGTYASYLLNWPPGSAMALTATLFYFANLCLLRWVRPCSTK